MDETEEQRTVLFGLHGTMSDHRISNYPENETENHVHKGGTLDPGKLGVFDLNTCIDPCSHRSR